MCRASDYRRGAGSTDVRLCDDRSLRTTEADGRVAQIRERALAMERPDRRCVVLPGSTAQHARSAAGLVQAARPLVDVAGHVEQAVRAVAAIAAPDGRGRGGAAARTARGAHHRHVARRPLVAPWI